MFWEPRRCAPGSGVCSTCWHSPFEGATIPERAALITALILDRPVCMACLRAQTGFTATLVEATLTRIQKALAVERDEARCHVCGTNGRVHSVQRPSARKMPQAADARCPACGEPI